MTLESHAIRGEECQTSTRDPGEWSAGRVHRRGRCSKLQLVSVAARYDGSVTAAAFNVDSSGRSVRPHRPSRLSLSDPRAILYVYTEPGSERTARAAHGFHMNLFRVAPRASGRKCATTAKSWRGAPNFFCGHVPRHPRGTPECNGARCRARPGSGASKRVRRRLTPFPGEGKGLTKCAPIRAPHLASRMCSHRGTTCG